MDKKLLSQAAEYIREADAIIIAAGAGMGVDSGLPDFRGNEGFWKAYPALAKARLDFSEVASPATFERDIKLAWGLVLGYFFLIGAGNWDYTHFR